MAVQPTPYLVASRVAAFQWPADANIVPRRVPVVSAAGVQPIKRHILERRQVEHIALVIGRLARRAVERHGARDDRFPLKRAPARVRHHKRPG
jgi:hypothetical protein